MRKRGIEPSRVSVKAILLVAGGLLLLLALIQGVVSLGEKLALRTTPSPPAPYVHPPFPRLQTTPRLDRLALERIAERKLHRYAWADRPRGIAIIPIEEAMHILAGKRPGESP